MVGYRRKASGEDQGGYIPQRKRPQAKTKALEKRATAQRQLPGSPEQINLVGVPFPAPQTVTQLELLALLSLRGRLHQLETQVESAEQSIKDRLEKGCFIEEGDHVATLKENLRRNVSWRDIVTRLGDRLFGNGKGQPYCEKVLASTKPSRSVSLVIE